MSIICLKHNDYPNYLQEQLESLIGDKAEIASTDDQTINLEFDDRYLDEIEVLVEGLMEENEWIYDKEIIG